LIVTFFPFNLRKAGVESQYVLPIKAISKGYPEGWQGDRRGLPLGTPSQAPRNPLETPSIPKANLKQIQKREKGWMFILKVCQK